MIWSISRACSLHLADAEQTAVEEGQAALDDVELVDLALAREERLPVEQMLEDYWDLLPTYQRNNCAAFRDGKVRARELVA